MDNLAAERAARDQFRDMGGKPRPEQPIQHRDEVAGKLASLPVGPPISAAALAAHQTCTVQELSTLPLETLQAARAAQLRGAHNDQVNQRNAKKRELKQLAKQAGITTDALRRMIGKR